MNKGREDGYKQGHLKGFKEYDKAIKEMIVDEIRSFDFGEKIVWVIRERLIKNILSKIGGVEK